MFTIPAGRSFDFQMEENPPDEALNASDEDTIEAVKPQRSKAKAKKRQKKQPIRRTRLKSKAGRKAKNLKRAAKKKAENKSTARSSRGVQEQIRLLNERIDRLDQGNSSSLSTSSASDVDGSNSHKSGFIPIEGTNTSVKVGGYIKADGIYDTNQFTGDASNLPNLRLRLLDPDASRSSVFTAHAKQTRIFFETETNTDQGEIRTYIEGDFFGSGNSGSSTGSFTRSDSSSSNSYNFRVRHAYGSYFPDKSHRFDIGQMWSLFYDPKSAGKTLEINGPETTAQIRRPQFRYTHAHKSWKFSVSAESGATEYLDISPSFVGTVATGLAAGSPSSTYNTAQYRRANNSFIGGSSGDGNQAMPDFVAHASFEKKNCHHISLSAMARELRIKKLSTTGPNDPTFSGKKYGYGASLGGRMKVYENSSIFAQGSLGKGIGTYIFALDGYGAAIDATQQKMQAQFAYGFLVGAEHYWCDDLRSNIIYSQSRVNVSSIIPSGRSNVMGLDAAGNLATLVDTGYSITNMMRQFYVNLLWSPAEKFELGIEYAYFRRDTINNYYGYGNRIQVGAYYKF